jgi:hypothetical protein
MWPVRWGGSSSNGGVVTDRIALVLGLLIVGLVGLDVFLNDGASLIFLARKLLSLMDYLRFWK